MKAVPLEEYSRAIFLLQRTIHINGKAISAKTALVPVRPTQHATLRSGYTHTYILFLNPSTCAYEKYRQCCVHKWEIRLAANRIRRVFSNLAATSDILLARVNVYHEGFFIKPDKSTYRTGLDHVKTLQ